MSFFSGQMYRASQDWSQDVEIKEEVQYVGNSGYGASRGIKRKLDDDSGGYYQEQEIKPECAEDFLDTKPSIADENSVALDTYNSDLNMVVSPDRYSAKPMTKEGFALMWGGVRGTYGVNSGKVAFEVRITEQNNVPHLPKEETHPHVLRVGWSTDDTSLALGEVTNSFGYGGTGKASENLKFKNYGKPFGLGDTLGCYVDFNNRQISFSKNGEWLGVAFSFWRALPAANLKPLFPHILTKNCSFEVNFGQQKPWYPLRSGYTFMYDVPQQSRHRATEPPPTKGESQVMMMVGLPACGKTTWCEKFVKENIHQKWNILGTNAIMDQMKVQGLTRKKNYHGRWDVLVGLSTGCLNKFLQIASKRNRNYIIDQTNVYPSARRRKMRPFGQFYRKAVVIVPNEADFAERCQKQSQVEGKLVPEEAVLEMKANFTLPDVSDGIFDDVEFIELQRADAQVLVNQYNDEGKQFKKPGFRRDAKRFKSGDASNAESGPGGRGGRGNRGSGRGGSGDKGGVRGRGRGGQNAAGFGRGAARGRGGSNNRSADPDGLEEVRLGFRGFSQGDDFGGANAPRGRGAGQGSTGGMGRGSSVMSFSRGGELTSITGDSSSASDGPGAAGGNKSYIGNTETGPRDSGDYGGGSCLSDAGKFGTGAVKDELVDDASGCMPSEGTNDADNSYPHASNQEFLSGQRNAMMLGFGSRSLSESRSNLGYGEFHAGSSTGGYRGMAQGHFRGRGALGSSSQWSRGASIGSELEGWPDESQDSINDNDEGSGYSGGPDDGNYFGYKNWKSNSVDRNFGYGGSIATGSSLGFGGGGRGSSPRGGSQSLSLISKFLRDNFNRSSTSLQEPSSSHDDSGYSGGDAAGDFAAVDPASFTSGSSRGGFSGGGGNRGGSSSGWQSYTSNLNRTDQVGYGSNFGNANNQRASVGFGDADGESDGFGGSYAGAGNGGLSGIKNTDWNPNTRWSEGPMGHTSSSRGIGFSSISSSYPGTPHRERGSVEGSSGYGCYDYSSSLGATGLGTKRSSGYGQMADSGNFGPQLPPAGQNSDWSC